MILPRRTADTLDLLCITARDGTLGLLAADVVAVREDGAPADLVPSLDLASVLGPGGRDTVLRRIRVAAQDVPPFDLVTDGVLSVRMTRWSSLVPVPAWLAPLVSWVDAELLLLEADALVLLADPVKLAAMCASVRLQEWAPPDPGRPPPEERPHD